MERKKWGPYEYSSERISYKEEGCEICHLYLVGEKTRSPASNPMRKLVAEVRYFDAVGQYFIETQAEVPVDIVEALIAEAKLNKKPDEYR